MAPDPSTAAQRLRTSREVLGEAEADLERRVSTYVGQMPFLWLEVPDPPGPDSERGCIERNAIALLSHAQSSAADVPSAQWLGCHSDRRLVRTAGLWNNRHVEENYDDTFLDVFATLVRSQNAEPRLF